MKKKKRKRVVKAKNKLKDFEIKNIFILFVAILSIVGIGGFVFYQIHQEIVLNKIEKETANKMLAREIVAEYTDYEPEDMRYVGKTEDNKYQLIIRETEGTATEKYYEVDVKNEEYVYVEVVDVNDSEDMILEEADVVEE